MNIGTTVKLKGGSPLMTILSEKNPDDVVSCGWFVNSEYFTKYFPIEALVESA